jgi:hypothetical protein
MRSETYGHFMRRPKCRQALLSAHGYDDATIDHIFGDSPQRAGIIP